MNLTKYGQMQEYADIFSQRGLSYHAAMRTAETARDSEFDRLFLRYPFLGSERIIDVPSGGGYLQSFLKRSQDGADPRITNLEFTSGFGETAFIVEPCGSWPLNPHFADRIICLAASHHIPNLLGLLDNFRLYLRHGGLIHIADVMPESGIALFLDNFVDKHTSTGHKGFYRNYETYNWPSWVNILCAEVRSCPWKFSSEHQMLLFCHKLFGLDRSAWGSLREALDRYIGIREADSGVELNWELIYVEANCL